MRILICKDYLSIGGITTYIMHLQKALKDENELHLLCTHYKGDYFDEAKKIFNTSLALDENTPVFFRLIKLRQIIKSINPDLIILNHTPLINILLPFLSKKIKVVSVIHSDDNRYYVQGTFFDPWVNLYLCPSPKLKNVLVNRYLINESKIKVIPHGVINTTSVVTKIQNSMIFIGNLDKHKGCEFFIDVFKKVQSKVPSVKFIIVGTGPYLNLLQDQITDASLSDNIKILLRLGHDEINKLLSKVEVLFFPTKIESFGFVIPEAMINSVIPVVSNIEGVTDQFIIDGQNGYLCDLNNPHCFSAKIIKIFLDENKIQMANEAKNKVLKEFSINVFTKNYKSLLGNFLFHKSINNINYILYFIKGIVKVFNFKLMR